MGQLSLIYRIVMVITWLGVLMILLQSIRNFLVESNQTINCYLLNKLLNIDKYFELNIVVADVVCLKIIILFNKTSQSHNLYHLRSLITNYWIVVLAMHEIAWSSEIK